MSIADQLKTKCSAWGQALNNISVGGLSLSSWKVRLALGAICLSLFMFSVAFWSKAPMLEALVDFGDLPDFSAYTDVNQMKADFFDYLQPMVEYYNSRILSQRQELESIYASLADGDNWQSQDKDFVVALAGQYDYELNEGWDAEVTQNISDHPFNRTFRQLMLRVDEIPIDLALVQAAKESGWGRSRFAVEANNLFGQWCYTEGCGLVPEQRSAGAVHEVRKFDSVAEAIGSYMKNLNSHASYETLRLIRGGQRSAADPISAMLLADGLIYYSQRREAYVDEIKLMIRQFHDFQESRTDKNTEAES